MRLSTVLLSSVLMTAINAAPALHTVFVTAFTTVLVDSKGNTIYPSATEAPAPAPTTQAPAPAPEPTTSSQAPAPAPEPTTSSQAPAPAPEPTTSSSSAPAPAETAKPSAQGSSSQPSGSIHHGQGTYYDTGMGACGVVSSDSDYIIAISHTMFDAALTDGNPNHNPLCGKKIRAFYGGNSVDVTIVDRCVGCAEDDLDFSPAAFKQIADPGLGRIDITWQWL
ncbi:uncharacterized protein SPAPADRAFT_62602 [Spathaspora passalidarum NRRL Y-27907]|uniref:RlpA-like protein double-psi beta-barrel domain-containing protein n=1 Tax=Spathaspora passalidarum (strain NRRL Y-27907 / 11-Y1) TaxID=619300 RepID=G3ASW3_SPAPN|nr:uncharacterized protein SPAPADRAFT_62602 [Spathaspora passalidarum NRRL Y-27907]EGW30745.1 hypothetical protein SPAPADRAFT_62602 [Spathaspora passalidarum NRRL Y-27907]